MPDELKGWHATNYDDSKWKHGGAPVGIGDFKQGGESFLNQPPFLRPPVFAAYFAEATKAKKATTGRPVRTIGSFRGLPHKANS